MLPPFTAEGFLPPGLHCATWTEFIARYADGEKRSRLLKGLQQIINLLAIAHCTEVRLGGSFVTAKAMPGDFDGIWMLEGVDESKLPLEIFASVGAQPDIFGGSLVPQDWEYNDIGVMAQALQTNKKGAPVGIVVLAPQEVPLTEPLARYRRFFQGRELSERSVGLPRT